MANFWRKFIALFSWLIPLFKSSLFQTVVRLFIQLDNSNVLCLNSLFENFYALFSINSCIATYTPT